MELTYLTLRCKNCEQDKCVFCPIGKIARGKEGCTRKVSEETAAKYIHYTEEVIPFWKHLALPQIKQQYNEIINFLFNEVYSAPIGQKLDSNGKVKTSSI